MAIAVFERNGIPVNPDCREYIGSQPCRFHKQDGRTCSACPDYTPQAERVLIVKLGSLGDVLRSTAILPALRIRYPQCHITWVTRLASKELLQGNPLVDRVLYVEENYLEFMCAERFDIGICMDAESLSAAIHTLADCAKRWGFVVNKSGRVLPANSAAEEWWIMGLNDVRKRENRKSHTELMYGLCELPPPFQRPQLTLEADATAWARQFLADSGLTERPALIGLNLGGSGRWAQKKWTVAHYVAFVYELHHLCPNAGILLLAGPEEPALYREVANSVGELAAGTGCDQPIAHVAALISATDVLVSSDSLAMHMGVALSRPTVALVGPTSPWELTVHGSGVVLHAQLDCIACYHARCPKPVTCMELLLPHYVAEQVVHLLPADSVRPRPAPK